MLRGSSPLHTTNIIPVTLYAFRNMSASLVMRGFLSVFRIVSLEMESTAGTTNASPMWNGNFKPAHCGEACAMA